MRITTPEQFLAFPVVNGVRQCPKADYQFGRALTYPLSHCQFAAGSMFSGAFLIPSGNRFGAACVFRDNGIFKDDCIFEGRCVFSGSFVLGNRNLFGTRCVFGSHLDFGNGHRLTGAVRSENVRYS